MLCLQANDQVPVCLAANNGISVQEKTVLSTQHHGHSLSRLHMQWTVSCIMATRQCSLPMLKLTYYTSPWLPAHRATSGSYAGSLPSSWGNARAFSSLQVLLLEHLSLSGTLPASWGNPGSMPSLSQLVLGGNNQIGSLPPEWGSPQAFQRLAMLTISDCNLTGMSDEQRQLMGKVVSQ